MRFFVSCAKGTEGPLRRELVALRIRAPRGDTGGVTFEGPFTDGLKACLWSRVGMRVLLELGAFPAADADELYHGARAVEWAAHLDARSTFAVSAAIQDSATLRHSGFAALKVKDAIADALRDRLGARPDVSADDPDVAVFLHVRGEDARLYLDLSGEPLHRRGYRVAMTDAPLKETLAAAVLALGGAAPDEPFVDPMCGSGTLAIEHALAARRIAPGAHRRFGFERWPDQQHASAWAALKAEAAQGALPAAPAPIHARDVAPAAVAAARRNAQAAGVAGDITFAQADVSALDVPGPPGTVCLNPPYGERMGAAPGRPARDDETRALEALYARIAQATTRLRGWRVAILTGTPLVARAFPRKPEISHRLWNGPIEARLLVYRL